MREEREPPRTWVNIYNETGARFHGFCAINTNRELASLKFLIEASNPQPKTVFIQFVDRFTSQYRRSKTIKLD